MSQPPIAGEEFERLWREEFNECCNDVREEMQQARANAKNGAQIVSYSQGQHSAITLQFAAHKALFLVLFRIYRRKREELEARVAAIESKGVEYRGVWQAAQDYKRGDLVTLDGSMWHANTTTRAKPGNGKAWTLAVKRGADAR